MGSAGLPLMLLLLLAGALAQIPGSEGGKETPAHFLYQAKHECRFLNGTRRVRYLYRYFYDREEFLRFDSARGEFEAVTALGKVYAEAFNRDKHELQYRKTGVDRFCRHNYEVFQSGSVIGRREPRSSNSARSKLWTGIVAAVIGVIFFAMGLSLHLKSKKAIPIQPPAALMN